MLTKLNEKQIKLMETIKDKWINNFFSLEFNQEKAEKMIDWLYEDINLKVTKIFVDSPFGVQYAFNLLNQVEKQVGSQVRSQVRSQVGEQVRNQVWEQVRSQVRKQVWEQVWEQVGEQVWNQVWEQVWNQKLKIAQFCYRADCTDNYWMAYYDYFSKIGIVKNKEFDKYKELCSGNIFMWVTLQNYAIVSKPPIFINRDEQNNLHCKNDYAIAFKDGYGQHYIHGVFFEPEQFNKFFNVKNYLAEDILSLENAEQKAVLIQEFGFESIFDKIKEKKIIDVQMKPFNKNTSKMVEYVLFEVDIGDINSKILKVEWYEKGRKRQTILGVPMNMKDAIEAVAWTLHTTKEKYETLLEMEA